MSNENNNGVIDFGGSTFSPENVDNATNPVSQESTTNAASNINVDDIFGSWDNSSSNTQSTATPVSNDYNNSNVNFNNDNSKMEGSNITSPSDGSLLETRVSDNQVESKETHNTNEGKNTTDNSELTELAMNAFSELTANGISLESQEQAGTVASQASEKATTNSALADTSSTISKNPDYMSVFANPFTNQTVSSIQSDSSTNTLEQSENTDASNLVGSNQALESTDSSVNVISDFNGFDDATNSLENVAGAANSVAKSKVTPENNGTDFRSLDSLNAGNAFDNQFVPNQNEVQAVEQVFSDNQVVSNPEGFSNQFAPVNQETADVSTTPVFGETAIDNQQTFNNGNVINPDTATFNTQNIIPKDEVSNGADVQSDVNIPFQNVTSNQEVAPEFNAVTPESQNTTTFNNLETSNFDSGNVINPEVGTFNAQNVIPQDKISNEIGVQPTLEKTTQGVNLENQMTSDFNSNNLNSQVAPTVNQEINNQIFNSNDNLTANSGNTMPDNGNVISPQTVTNLQQALRAPANNVALENSISVGSIPNNGVAQPAVNDNNQDGTKTPPKKQGKIGLSVVILIIIIVVSVGIIVLRRNELMDFFQTLMNK